MPEDYRSYFFAATFCDLAFVLPRLIPSKASIVTVILFLSSVHSTPRYTLPAYGYDAFWVRACHRDIRQNVQFTLIYV